MPRASPLPGEDLIVAVVIADGRQNGRIRGEGQSSHPRPFLLEPAHDFGRPVLGIRSRAPVAAEHHLAAGGQGQGNHPCRLFHRLQQPLAAHDFMDQLLVFQQPCADGFLRLTI